MNYLYLFWEHVLSIILKLREPTQTWVTELSKLDESDWVNGESEFPPLLFFFFLNMVLSMEGLKLEWGLFASSSYLMGLWSIDPYCWYVRLYCGWRMSWESILLDNPNASIDDLEFTFRNRIQLWSRRHRNKWFQSFNLGGCWDIIHVDHQINGLDD